MLLGFDMHPAFHEGFEQADLGSRIEGREVDPAFYIRSHFMRVVLQKVGQPFKQSCMAGAIAAALGCQPMIKLWAAIEMQAFQKVSCEKTAKLSQAIKIERSDTCPDCSLDLKHIDEAIFQVQGDHLASGRDPGTVQLIKDGAQLAEAPTQFSPGIIGNIAQEFAKA